MTCRTLLALISAAVIWNLPHNIMAQAKQGGSEQTPGAATDAKDSANEDSAVLQMQAKKTPPKPKAKAKKGKAPAKPKKTKPPVKTNVKATPRAQPKPAPFFPPAPQPVLPPVEPAPADATRFNVPLPEAKGDLNIWATEPEPSEAAADPSTLKNQFGLLGVVNYLGAGFGLEYLRRSLSWMDWGLQFTSTQAGLTESQNPETDEFLDSRMLSAKATARFFNNRWIYLATGLGFNSIAGSYGWKGSGVANQEISTDFKAQLIQFDLALGSQWEPGKGFYIGVDWVGLGVPLAGAIDYDAKADLDDLSRILTGSTAEERIRNELGVQFRPYYMLMKFGYML